MSAVAAIMQPTYLPYLGYFHLIAASDVFVFLDDVQFARRSWQSRNRILTANGELMLTVPVKKHDRDTPISDIAIDDSQGWRDKHLAAVSHAYGKRPGFAQGWNFLSEHLAAHRDGKLADFNADLIEAAARRLGLAARFERASALGCGEARSEHLLALCRAVGATRYVSPTGSADYMEEDGVFAAAGFPVRFQGFVQVDYPQGRNAFTPYMSFVDALMNLGWEGLGGLIARMNHGPLPSSAHPDDRP